MGDVLERLYINARVAEQIAREAGNLELADKLRAYGGECVCFVNGKFDGMVVAEDADGDLG